MAVPLLEWSTAGCTIVVSPSCSSPSGSKVVVYSFFLYLINLYFNIICTYCCIYPCLNRVNCSPPGSTSSSLNYSIPEIKISYSLTHGPLYRNIYLSIFSW